MTDRLLIDLDEDGQVMVSVLGDVQGGLPEPAKPFPLIWTLDAADAEELRWYLEDYLRAPYGVYEQRGERTAQRLVEWGRAVFTAVFDGSRAARDAYVRSRAGGGLLEIVVRSVVAERLGLPWELLTDPARPTPLALDGVRIRRALPTADLAGTFKVAGARLRVLMVISRPAGDRDVGYRMVARPLLHRLEAVRGDVDLVVLRPPTLDRLREVLAQARAAGEPFQVVHFDGHGAFTQRRAPSWGAAVTLGSGPEGVLVFEQSGGGADRVPAGRVAAVLAEAEVPVVVLNACQSGALGREVEAAVATRLLQQGAAVVVAMAFSVYAVAAAEFMTAFYERLFTGGQIADAVTAGRQRLAERPRRPSPKGALPLQDWIVPVLYARQDVSFPYLRRTPTASDAPTVGQILDLVRQQPDTEHQEDSLAAVGSFVGRDALFYELEVAARLQKVVLLHGSGGTGKTELVKAFGRWWRDTGGVDNPNWVIWHSFEPGIASFGLPGILTTIGLHVFGPDFAQLDDGQRLDAVLRLLREHRLLLIWDNFESVHSMPDPTGATPPLGPTGLQQLTDFLGAAADSSSAVLITSRSTEPELGDIRRIGVTGLNPEEADEYTDTLLQPYPHANHRRKDPAFADLMSRLDGHPLSMRLVLPHLNATEPHTILTELQASGGNLLGQDSRDRTTSLAASIGYSYRHLTHHQQQALPVLSLFHGAVDANLLATLSTVATTPEQFRNRTAADWTVLLDRATDLGLLTAIDAGMYTIHPAVPAYLTTQWQHQHPTTYPQQRAAAETVLLTACALFAGWLEQQIGGGDAQLALRLTHVHRQTLGATLNHALITAHHTEAADIAMVLSSYWDTLGLTEEARGWTDRIQHATETADGSPPALDTPAGALWLLMVGRQAGRQTRAHQLDTAEYTYHRILNMLNCQPDTPSRSHHLAFTHHQLGSLAQKRGNLDTAEHRYQVALAIYQQVGDQPGIFSTYQQLGWIAQQRGDLDTAEHRYQQALTINKHLGSQRSLASSYSQLGLVAQQRGDLDTAEHRYQQALTINKHLGSQPAMAGCYHQLGMLAQDRRDLDTAEHWYQQALTINDHLGDQPGLAVTYHQLGTLAEDRKDLDTAEHWHQHALTINDGLGNQPGIATSCHHLGIVAQHRGDLDTAEHRYQQALTIIGQLGNPSGLVNIYGQLGLLAEARGIPQTALEWTIRAISLFPDFPHPATGPAPHHLVRLTTTLGWNTLHTTWQHITGQPTPPNVTAYIQATRKRGTTT